MSGEVVMGNPSGLVPWQDLFDTMRWPERKNQYFVHPEDEGSEISCAVIVNNRAGSTDELTENPALVVSA